MAAPQTETRDRALAEVRRAAHLARLKSSILTDTGDPTDEVNSVLLLGTQALGYKCISGYHDELVAWHLGYCRAEGVGQYDAWEDKRWVSRPGNAGPRHISAVLAPRGTGKTVWATVLAVWYGLRNRNVRVLVTSKTDTAAVRLGGVIRRLLINPVMVEMFGDLKGDTWDKHAFNIADRTRAEGASTYTLLGSGTQIEGVHFDVVFADDVVTLKNSRTVGQRTSLWEWFWQTLVPTCRPMSDVLPRGRIHASGTRYHAQDMHQKLMDHGGGWQEEEAYKRFPALRPSAKWSKAHAQLVRDWTQATTLAVSEGREPPAAPEPEGAAAEIEENWESLAPEFLPVDVLLEMRRDMPRPFFDAQYQVDARLLKGRLFKSDWVRWVDETPEMRAIPGSSGMDLGLSLKEEADYTALVHVKLDREWSHPETGQKGRLLVWDATVEHLDLAGKLRLLKSDHRMNRPRAIAVESVQAQSLIVENPELSALPVIPVRPVADKLTRASLLLTYFQTGRIFFVDRAGPRAARINEHLQQCVYQLLDFQGDDSTKDDAVDALGFAVDQVVHHSRLAVDAVKKPESPDQENPMGFKSGGGLSIGSRWRGRQ